jgi:hypothetical protein
MRWEAIKIPALNYEGGVVDKYNEEEGRKIRY